METWVVQTRWIGDSEWTNAVYVGSSMEEAKTKALASEQDTENELAADDGREPTVFGSLDDIGNGDFFYEAWLVETNPA